MHRIISSMRFLLPAMLFFAGAQLKAQQESNPGGAPLQKDFRTASEYEAAKTQWVKSHPEAYKAMTEQQSMHAQNAASHSVAVQKAPRQQVQRSWVESLSPEKQKIVRDNTDMYEIVDDSRSGSTTVIEPAVKSEVRSQDNHSRH